MDLTDAVFQEIQSTFGGVLNTAQQFAQGIADDTGLILELPTPALITAKYQAIWEDRAARAGISLNPILPCDRTSAELAHLEASGKRLGYIPSELATSKARYILSKIFPPMKAPFEKKGCDAVKEKIRTGWFDYEVDLDGSYHDLTEEQLKKILIERGRVGMNLTEYIIASQDSKLLTGHYLDEDTTRVRLLGALHEGRVIDAGFDTDGSLSILSFLQADYHDSELCGRSVGTK